MGGRSTLRRRAAPRFCTQRRYPIMALGHRSFLAAGEGFRPAESNICSMGKKIYDWSEIQRFYDAGATEAQTRKRFALFPSTFSKAVTHRRLILRHEDANRPRTGPRNWKYDWAAVQAYHDAGHTVRQCMAHFGFCSAAWTVAVRKGRLKARSMKRPIRQVILGGLKNRSNVKRRLLEAGILENRCSECGITDWRGKPLSIQIDHRNGIRDDHRLENLRMLCPNCHSQTETFGARNRRRKQRSRVAQFGRAPDSDSGGSSFDPKLGSHSPLIWP